MIRYLSADEIQSIALSVTGIDPVVRDPNLLSSAAGRPQHTFGGSEMYPGLWDKAACLIEGVARNHYILACLGLMICGHTPVESMTKRTDEAGRSIRLR